MKARWLVFGALVVGCGSSVDDQMTREDGIQDDDGALRKRIEDATAPPPIEERATVEVSQRLGARLVGDATQCCVFRRMQGVALYDTLATFNPNADAIWPGALIQSIDLPRGLARPIALPRAPARLVVGNVTIDGEGAKTSAELPSPSLGAATAAIGEMLRSGRIATAAKTSTTVSHVYSMQHLAASLGFSVEGITGSVAGLFKTDVSRAKTNLLVRVSQEYFTVSMEAPSAPEAVFARGVRAEDAGRFMGPGNPPLYVSTVTYGRVLYLGIQTEEDASHVTAQLEVATKAVDVEASAEVDAVLQKTSIQAFAMGGGAEIAAKMNLATPQNYRKLLQEYLLRGATVSPDSPGVPIAYSARRLADNQLVKLASTLDYEVPSCGGDVTKQELVIEDARVTHDGKLIGRNSVGLRVLARTLPAQGDDGWADVTAQSGYGDNWSPGQIVGKTLLVDAPRSSGTGVELKLVASGEDTQSCTAAHLWNPRGEWTNMAPDGSNRLDCSGRVQEKGLLNRPEEKAGAWMRYRFGGQASCAAR